MEGSLRAQGKQRWRPGGLDEPRSVGLSLPCAGPVKTRALLPPCHFHPTAQRKRSFLYSVHQNLTQRPCAALSHPCPQVTALTWKTSPGLPSGRAWEHLDGLISETPDPAPSLQAPRVLVVSLCQGPCPLHPQRVAWISSCLSTETLGCPGSSACCRHQTSVVCKVHGGCGGISSADACSCSWTPPPLHVPPAPPATQASLGSLWLSSSCPGSGTSLDFGCSYLHSQPLHRPLIQKAPAPLLLRGVPDPWRPVLHSQTSSNKWNVMPPVSRPDPQGWLWTFSVAALVLLLGEP